MANLSRESHSYPEFHESLSIALKNMYAVRDPLMPVQLVLDKGIGMLTEAYRYNVLKIQSHINFIILYILCLVRTLSVS